jgi:hypothetical protein
MLNFNDGLPAIIQPDHATIKSRDRTQLGKVPADLSLTKINRLGIRYWTHPKQHISVAVTMDGKNRCPIYKDLPVRGHPNADRNEDRDY